MAVIDTLKLARAEAARRAIDEGYLPSTPN
jgi:hypothetical protein